jgi:hypothetical protein
MMPLCLPYEPGVVLALERAYTPPTYRDVWLSPSGDTAYYPSTATVLRRYYTAPNDELRILGELTTRSEVLAASLNYLGDVTSEAAKDFQAISNRLSSARCYENEVAKESAIELFLEGKCQPIPRGRPDNVAVIVDVRSNHAQSVATQLRETYRKIRGKDPKPTIILTFENDLHTGADLHALCLLLLSVGELSTGRIG